MKILRIISSMDPKGGGPSEGIRQVGMVLAQSGHRTECLTADDPQASWLPSQPLPIHALGPGRGSYSYCAGIGPWLQQHARSYDAIILSGLWQHPGLIARNTLVEMGVPYLIFPHGMLDPWFKYEYPLKHFKKWLYWPWGDYRVLRDARAVLFTSEEERLRARESFWLYRARESVVNYGTKTPPQDTGQLCEIFLGAHPELRDKRILLFLGRIHEKKGCDLLIHAFAKVASETPALHLVMAGPDQTRWVSELKQLASRLGVARRITWPGMLQGDMKWGAFHSSEAFVLPSHQENFGIAVAEALGCGLPVLISNKVNIWREIQADGAGFIGPDTVEGTLQVLRSWIALDPVQRGEMQTNARTTFANRYTVEAMAKSLIDNIKRHIQG